MRNNEDALINEPRTDTLAALLGANRRWRRDNDNADGWTRETIDRLGVLTGRPGETLIHALPALNDQFTRHSAPPAAAAVGNGCRRCTARRGIHGLVIRRAFSHECVCLRHRCWLGGANQHSLDRLPNILRANPRHRRLVRRAGPEAQHAFQQAITELTTWFQTGQPELRQRWTQRLAQLDDDPYLDPHHPSRDRIQLATYPETVTLTSVFTSPHWRHRPDLLDEARRRLGLAPTGRLSARL